MLKHIFTVHSPITFLVAYATINNLKLDKEDVIIISAKYKVPIDGFNVVESFQEKNASWWKKIIQLNVPISYDKYIQKITNGANYIAYIDLMSYYQRILITNRKCKQFHFIEEGTSAYMAYDDLTDLTWSERKQSYRNNFFSKTAMTTLTRVLRGYNLRLLSIPYHYMAYANFKEVSFFSFSKNAFFNISNDKRVTLTLDKEDDEIKRLAKNIHLIQKVIWIDGSGKSFTGLSDEYYHDALTAGLKDFLEKGIVGNEVYLKLKPGIKDPNQNFLYHLLNKAGIKVHLLPDDIILECVFATSKDCTVIGNLSAALEYAHVFGHKAYSVYSKYKEQPKTYYDKMSGFWKNVIKIKK